METDVTAGGVDLFEQIWDWALFKIWDLLYMTSIIYGMICWILRFFYFSIWWNHINLGWLKRRFVMFNFDTFPYKVSAFYRGYPLTQLSFARYIYIGTLIMISALVSNKGSHSHMEGLFKKWIYLYNIFERNMIREYIGSNYRKYSL